MEWWRKAYYYFVWLQFISRFWLINPFQPSVGFHKKQLSASFITGNYIRPHRASGNVRQKIELHPTKSVSQRTQLSSVTLKKYISYRRIKTQKHSVSIELPYSGSFYEHFYIQLTYAVFFIFKIVKCVSVERFYTNTLFFCPVWGSVTSEKISQSLFRAVTRRQKKSKENISHPLHFKLGKWNNRHRVY